MRVRRLRWHKLGMNRSQLINPGKCNFWKENLFPAWDRGFRSLVSKQILEQPKLSHAATEVINDVLSCWTEPWDVAEVGNSPSLPPNGAHYRFSVTCSGVIVCLIPMSWASHGHTEPTLDTKPIPPGLSWQRPWKETDLYRNTGNSHILLICPDPIMLPALFPGFGSKYIAALTTSTFSTKDSVIKYSRLQHTRNQSSLPVWICNAAVWKHLGTISAQILLEKGQIYFLLNQMLFDWL